MADAFSVDLNTGRLMFDDNAPPFFVQPELINAATRLLVDGYGAYSLLSGNVWVEGSGFAQPSRELSASGAITLIDGTVITLTGDDIVSYQTNFDVGSNAPIGATPSATIALQLANDDRRWDYGGSEIGIKTLDGAIVTLQMSSYCAVSDADFIVTPNIIDGELLMTGDGEESLFAVTDGELIYTGDNAYTVEDGDLTVTDDLYLWGYQYMDAGVYVIDKIDNQQHLPYITLSGSDYMGNYMMTEYVDDNTYPATYQTIIEDVCDQAGVTLKSGNIPFYNSTITVKPVMPTGKITTCRDVAGWVAALAGANAVINTDGELEVRAIDDVGERISPARYIKLTTNNDFASMNYTVRLYEYSAPVDTPPLEKTYSLNGAAPYYIIDIRDNPYLFYGNANNQTILDNRLNLVALWIFARHSARIEWAGSDTISPLDTVTVELLNGNEILVGATQHMTRFDMGLSMETGCDLPSVTMANSLTAYR